jgi:hypothetical protein
MRLLTARRHTEIARQQGASLALACLLLAGCNDPVRGPAALAEPTPVPASFGQVTRSAPVATAANPTPAATARDASTPLQIDARLIVLHVQTPRAARAAVAGVWDLVREDALDSGTAARLNSNGVRAGMGQIARWDAVRAVFNGTENSRAFELPPLPNPPGRPLALNLDSSPRDQTIFCLDDDGILSGDSWPASQKALRLTYALDLQRPEQILLTIVPEIRQELPPALTYTKQDGWDTGRRREGRAYASAAFTLPLTGSEFVLIGPGENSDVFGILGGAFLTDVINSERYDAYVFIRAEINHGRPSR